VQEPSPHPIRAASLLGIVRVSSVGRRHSDVFVVD